MHSRPRETLPTVPFGGGPIMLWGHGPSAGTGNLIKVEGRVDSSQRQQNPDSLAATGNLQRLLMLQRSDLNTDFSVAAPKSLHLPDLDQLLQTSCESYKLHLTSQTSFVCSDTFKRDC